MTPLKVTEMILYEVSGHDDHHGHGCYAPTLRKAIYLAREIASGGERVCVEKLIITEGPSRDLYCRLLMHTEFVADAHLVAHVEPTALIDAGDGVYESPTYRTKVTKNQR